MPDLVDQRIKLSSHVVQARQIPRERVLRSNRFADDRPAIDASTNPIEMPSSLPEILQQEGFVGCETPRASQACPKRFELLTPRFVVWCSIQLSYGRVLEARTYWGALPNARTTASPVREGGG